MNRGSGGGREGWGREEEKKEESLNSNLGKMVFWGRETTIFLVFWLYRRSHSSGPNSFALDLLARHGAANSVNLDLVTGV